MCDIMYIKKIEATFRAKSHVHPDLIYMPHENLHGIPQVNGNQHGSILAHVLWYKSKITFNLELVAQTSRKGVCRVKSHRQKASGAVYV